MLTEPTYVALTAEMRDGARHILVGMLVACGVVAGLEALARRLYASRIA